jgi:hypothetical protein
MDFTFWHAHQMVTSTIPEIDFMLSSMTFLNQLLMRSYCPRILEDNKPSALSQSQRNPESKALTIGYKYIHV